ncbi:MAG TPA: hypothetical protein VHE78_02830 [Gemmatimonadaceae bacterium]|nr:hypothetical protein [Gemmatimonadaceae bacterium]
MEPYRPRPISRLPLLRPGDWTLKRYAIVYDGEFNAERFRSGEQLAVSMLPSPAVMPGRIGVGILIDHQGRDVDYVVIAWWDRENELPIRVFVRERHAEATWRPARGAESVCVWDLEIIWAERQAYVATVLTGGLNGGRLAYLHDDAVAPFALRTWG